MKGDNNGANKRASSVQEMEKGGEVDKERGNSCYVLRVQWVRGIKCRLQGEELSSVSIPPP